MNYRESHIGKGPDYDQMIMADPFSAYIAKWESRILRRIVLKYYNLNQDEKVPYYLDFACGTGRIASTIENLCHHSYAVDISHSMVEVAKRKCKRTTFVVGDITRDVLNLPRFDLITSFRFFGNAEDELRHQVLLQLRLSLSRNGYLIINNHRNPSSIMNMVHRMSGQKDSLDLTLSKLTKLLDSTGFEIVKAYGIGIWIWHWKMLFSQIESKLVYGVEYFSRLPGAAKICPDMIVVAKLKS